MNSRYLFQEFIGTVIEDLPDVALIEIFRLLHPIDRVHSASLVCTRWNRLLYTPGIWTDVRIIVSPYSLRSGCAKRFLFRVGSSIQKLCLCLTGSEADYPRANEVGDILPSVMPQVTLLDVGYFAGFFAYRPFSLTSHGNGESAIFFFDLHTRA
uniref:F-box domain-containing protein n=2 Tax=Parascaris univalens TaxID=6257 RepID=A0A915AKB4_PARUN